MPGDACRSSLQLSLKQSVAALLQVLFGRADPIGQLLVFAQQLVALRRDAFDLFGASCSICILRFWRVGSCVNAAGTAPIEMAKNNRRRRQLKSMVLNARRETTVHIFQICSGKWFVRYRAISRRQL